MLNPPKEIAMRSRGIQMGILNESVFPRFSSTEMPIPPFVIEIADNVATMCVIVYPLVPFRLSICRRCFRISVSIVEKSLCAAFLLRLFTFSAFGRFGIEAKPTNSLKPSHSQSWSSFPVQWLRLVENFSRNAMEKKVKRHSEKCVRNDFRFSSWLTIWDPRMRYRCGMDGKTANGSNQNR